MYAFAGQLQELHRCNRHVPDKTRQQLQVLRDLGLVEFLGRGRYGSLWREAGALSAHHRDTEALRVAKNKPCLGVSVSLWWSG